MTDSSAVADLNRFADDFSDLAKQADDDVCRWNDECQASGKRDAEMNDHDVAIIAAGRGHDRGVADAIKWLADAGAHFYPDPSTREPMCELGDGDIYDGRDGWDALLMAVTPVEDTTTRT